MNSKEGMPRADAADEERVEIAMNLLNKNIGRGRQTPHDRPGSGRPVDLVHLERQTLGNRSLECEVLELFQSRSELYLKRLKDADEDRDWMEAAHAIKGSARGIGAWRVADSAQAAEILSGEARAAGCLAVLDDLEGAISEANCYIESLLSGAGHDAPPNAAA